MRNFDNYESGRRGVFITKLNLIIQEEQIYSHEIATVFDVSGLPEPQQPASTTEEHLPNFKSEKNSLELAIKP